MGGCSCEQDPPPDPRSGLLWWAIFRGEKERALKLIKEGADVNEHSEHKIPTPLEAASELGDIEIVEALVEHGADVNLRSPLFYAVLYGRIEVVRFLLAKGADINHCSRGVRTPTALLGACSPNVENVEILKLLVKNGIDMSCRDDQYIPLHEAAFKGYADTVQCLLELGVKVDRINSDGRSPLHRAAAGGNEEIVKLFLDRKLAVDLRDVDGRTSLHAASVFGREGALRLLLDSGADVDIRDNAGDTAEDVAKREGYPGAAKLLAEHSAAVRNGRKRNQ